MTVKKMDDLQPRQGMDQHRASEKRVRVCHYKMLMFVLFCDYKALMFVLSYLDLF
jgi:hypothetical protein